MLFEKLEDVGSGRVDARGALVLEPSLQHPIGHDPTTKAPLGFVATTNKTTGCGNRGIFDTAADRLRSGLYGVHIKFIESLFSHYHLHRPHL
jgi:hypothetical protein